jgi:DNA-binding protein H-NS
MSQYADLKAQIAKLQAQADDARRTEVGNVIAEIQQKIVEYGLTAHDLGFAEAARRGRPPKKVPLPPKYQDPKSGSTWSGRGKPPKWIVGKNRERFLIQP